jgi:hypothetical protein
MSQPQPQLLLAQWYMAHKGYPDLDPYEVDKLDDQDCWYFYYQLPEGILELEVYYDQADNDWQVAVTAFPATDFHGAETSP